MHWGFTESVSNSTHQNEQLSHFYLKRIKNNAYRDKMTASKKLPSYKINCKLTKIHLYLGCKYR